MRFREARTIVEEGRTIIESKFKNKATVMKGNNNKAFFIEGQLRKWGE